MPVAKKSKQGKNVGSEVEKQPFPDALLCAKDKVAIVRGFYQGMQGSIVSRRLIVSQLFDPFWTYNVLTESMDIVECSEPELLKI